MACVTLKRPVDALGSPHLMEHEPTVKRRCGMSMFPTTPPGINSMEPYGLNVCPESSRGSPGPSRHHSVCGSPLSASRGTKRMKKRKLDIDHYSPVPSTPPVSPFLSATPPLETGKAPFPGTLVTSVVHGLCGYKWASIRILYFYLFRQTCCTVGAGIEEIAAAQVSIL